MAVVMAESPLTGGRNRSCTPFSHIACDSRLGAYGPACSNTWGIPAAWGIPGLDIAEAAPFGQGGTPHSEPVGIDRQGTDRGFGPSFLRDLHRSGTQPPGAVCGKISSIMYRSLLTGALFGMVVGGCASMPVGQAGSLAGVAPMLSVERFLEAANTRDLEAR